MSPKYQTPVIAPRPLSDAPSSPTPSVEPKQVSARILRKREADRRCQRMIRERTKSRIAHLEEMVEDFKRKDVSGQVEALMKQLSDTQRERDTFARKVQSIESIISDRRVAVPRTSGEEITDKAVDNAVPQGQYIRNNDDVVRSVEEGEEQEMDLQDYEGTTYVTNDPESAPITHNNDQSPSVIWPETLPPHTTGDLPDPLDSIPLGSAAHFADPVHPRPGSSCDCCLSRVHGLKKKFNYWRFANELLSSRFTWPAYVRQLENKYKDDIPVRAVLDGWDAVEEREPLHPSWMILKQVDQTIFVKCSPRERIAVLYTMHLLFESHLNPTLAGVVELPNYYLKRPSETVGHSYATDYFIWPGIRERFVYDQHRYCTNDFWHILTRNLRLLWPYELRDCYSRNTETGLYKISPLFRDHIRDVKVWAMGTEMFERWPELKSDIPVYNSIPGSISNCPNSRLQMLVAAPNRHNFATDSQVDSVEDGDAVLDSHSGHAQNAIGTSQRHVYHQQPYPGLYRQMISGMTWPDQTSTRASIKAPFDDMSITDVTAYIPHF